MATMFKCDWCKKNYEPMNKNTLTISKDGQEIVKKVQFPRGSMSLRLGWHGIDGYRHNFEDEKSQFDICPDCYKELKRLIQERADGRVPAYYAKL